MQNEYNNRPHKDWRFVLPLLIICSMCGRVGHDHEAYLNYQRLKDSTEKSTGYFNPAFYSDSLYYITLTYVIDDYQVSLADRGVTVYPGQPPKPDQDGSMHISMLGGRNDTLSSYRMESPLYYRVEHGGDRGWYRVRNGSFKIRVPGDSLFAKRISRIVIEDDGVVKAVSETSKLFAKF